MSIQSECIDPEAFLNIPEEGMQTAAFVLWHTEFECTIMKMHLVSHEVLKQTGTVSTGFKEIDREMARERIRVRMTAATMAVYVSEGATIELVNPQDAAKIYRTIHQHLKDWLHASKNDLNLVKTPDQALRILDEFAAVIYPYAKPFLSENPFHGRLANQLDSVIRRRGGMMRRNALTGEPTNLPSTQSSLPQGHTPMADAIALPAANRRKEWQ